VHCDDTTPTPLPRFAHRSPGELKSGRDISQAELSGRTGRVFAQLQPINRVFAQFRLSLAHKLGYIYLYVIGGP
jgi:hypothetical protein